MIPPLTSSPIPELMPSAPLERYRNLMNDGAYRRLSEQYEAFNKGTLPKIADDVIKEIPIEESEESCLDITVVQNLRIQMLPSPSNAFAHPECNSGCFDAGVVRSDVFNKLENTILELDKIAPEFGYAKRQISLKVFEAFRNTKTQRDLFEKKYAEIEKAKPHFSREEIRSETLKYASPVDDNVPAHATGAAVDLRLYDEKAQKLLDLGQYGVFWGDNPYAATFSKDLTPDQQKNRLLLAIAANNAGLVNYPYEYWHFSSGDRYAAYWKKEPTACYGERISGNFFRR